MSEQELMRLAERCEAATGADRELDRAIELALPVYEDAKHLVFGVPAYTASLDAAMSLVPEHSLYTARTLWDRDKVAGFASISRYEQAGESEPLRRYWMDEHQSNAATPALALCAAALRARAQGAA